MESKFVTLINKENNYVKILDHKIEITDIPILFLPDITINDLKQLEEYREINFENIDLIGISIVKLYK